MMYMRTETEPTEEQLAAVAGTVIAGETIGQPGFFFVAFDDAEYSMPEWLVGDHVNVPGEVTRCPDCGGEL